jgi:hypothetical protein
MYTDYKFDEIIETPNAIVATATFYAGEFQDVPQYQDDPESGLPVQVGTENRYVRTEYLKQVRRQFPLDTPREEITAWFNTELAHDSGERTPLWT